MDIGIKMVYKYINQHVIQVELRRYELKIPKFYKHKTDKKHAPKEITMLITFHAFTKIYT